LKVIKVKLPPGQASLKVLSTCEHRSEKNVPAEKIECNRWPDVDLDEKCLQKFEVWDFMPESSTHHLCKLMVSAPGYGQPLKPLFSVFVADFRRQNF